MTMNWCLTIALTLMVLLLVMPSLVSGGSACPAMYSKYRATHTNCQPGDPKAKLQPISKAKQDDIVKLHNKFRRMAHPSASNMMKMYWDNRLAKTARKHMKRCTGDHDEMPDRMEPDWINVKIGQNLGMGHNSFEAMLARFWTEQDRYNYTYGAVYPGDAYYPTGAGHFFQLATAVTTRVGCAEVKCPFKNGGSATWRACNYAPALNAAKLPYKSGPWCADCPGHCDSSGKLCDCRNRICQHGGILDAATCKCQCSGMWTGDSCETLDCSRNDPENCERHNATECGNKGYVNDPKMCPHLCEVCHNCKGVKCQNGGKVNYATCTCECDGDYIGDHCETLGCHTKDHKKCTEMLPRDNCVESSPTSAAPTFKMCPIFCRKCKIPANCTECLNYGDLTTKPECSCECKGGFTGDHCKLCPMTEKAECPHLPKEWCTTASMAIYLQTNCPFHCGICNAPGAPSVVL